VRGTLTSGPCAGTGNGHVSDNGARTVGVPCWTSSLSEVWLIMYDVSGVGCAAVVR
jgi:hypothetical protein